VTHFHSLTPGTDNFAGQADDYNAFQFDPTTLQSTDTVTGATGSFLDLLIVTTGGTILGSQFAGVTNMEELFLANDGNNVTLIDSLVAGSSIGFFAVVDGEGSDTVDASAVTAMPVVFFAAGGSDSFKGGHGNDAIVIAAADLTSANRIEGGSGIDNLYVSSAGFVDASAFNHVSGIEGIVLNAQGNAITLTNSLVGSSDNGVFAVADGDGNDVIDASGVTNGVSIAFLASGGGDTFRGGNGADGFVFKASDLTAADTVQGGAGIDNLFIATAGTLDASSFTNVTGTEAIVLADGVNHVTLSNGLVAGTSLGYFVIAGGSGNDTVDASGVNNATPIAFFGIAGGNDTFTGGNGNDSFLFAADQLGASDTVSGGGGSDTLWITTAGTIDAAKLAGVSGVEGVLLQNGGTFDFADHITTASTFAAVGSGAIDAFDGSSITAYAINFAGHGGADDLKGGSRDDTFLIPDSSFAGIDGGGGIDRITLTEANQSLDVSANAGKIHNIEVISLDSVDHGSVTLTGADIAQISSANSLYIVGDTGDTYEAGTGYTQIGSGIVNDAVASGHFFYEFQHTGGSLLYIDSNFFGPVSTDGPVDILSENSPVNHLVYTDPSTFLPGTTVTHTLFGTDAALFDIDATTGDVTFKASPDFEDPQDQGKNNHYDFDVATNTDRAVPGTFQVSGAIVTDVNDNAPVFPSETDATTTPENVATTTAVYTAHATDADGTTANNTVGYFLVAGVGDNDLFNIDANGDVRFKVSPDYETPMDSDHDNQYDIQVTASDGLHAHDAALHVAITVSDLLLL
jgi:hypothetical protein